jgi:hypothetical protein
LFTDPLFTAAAAAHRLDLMSMTRMQTRGDACETLLTLERKIAQQSVA